MQGQQARLCVITRRSAATNHQTNNTRFASYRLHARHVARLTWGRLSSPHSRSHTRTSGHHHTYTTTKTPQKKQGGGVLAVAGRSSGVLAVLLAVEVGSCAGYHTGCVTACTIHTIQTERDTVVPQKTHRQSQSSPQRLTYSLSLSAITPLLGLESTKGMAGLICDKA